MTATHPIPPIELPSAFRESISREALGAPASGIVEVSNYGRTRPGMIGLWTGEGDTPTPAFIQEAATRSLAAGETFYTWQRGLPELREALARWHERTYGGTFPAERFFVTGSGMQSIQIAIGITTGPGDELLVPTPCWPNAAAAAGVRGARTVPVPMTYGQGGFSLDLERLAASITPKSRAIFINSPSNPSGWVATREELAAILALARRHGLWIIADEIYTLFWYGEGPRAPSFRDVMEPEDRVIFVQTFSKNWAMTGWRIGWIEAHPSLGPVIENMIQYATSGVAAFMQRGAIAALDRGDGFVAHQIARAREGREIACRGLGATGRCRFVWPQGAFYLFFQVDGETDMRRLALDLVDRANVGLAPGTAFGPGGESFLRLCFLRSAGQLQEAVDRLAATLGKG